ncbi:MAG: cytochrome C [Gammaproteobacteria bacterium]|nr:cytochrome C [Gammaproteobacteria bacterium]
MRRTRRSPNLRTTFRAAFGIVALAYSGYGTAQGETDDNPGSRTNDAARFDYLLHCSGCHRPDGTGSAPDVPSLRRTMGSLVATPEGREYIARVPEVAQSPLDDDDLARLLNWVLQEFNADTLPEGFRPLEGGEVARARARILADPIRARKSIVATYREE